MKLLISAGKEVKLLLEQSMEKYLATCKGYLLGVGWRVGVANEY